MSRPLYSTSTPLHALTTLNDPTWVEAARAFAQTCLQRNADLDGQLSYAFRRILSRVPQTDDMQRLRRAYQNQWAIYRDAREAAEEFLSVGATRRDESLDVAQHAALAAVCLGIMNCDEALTRE